MQLHVLTRQKREADVSLIQTSKKKKYYVVPKSNLLRPSFQIVHTHKTTKHATILTGTPPSIPK